MLQHWMRKWATTRAQKTKIEEAVESQADLEEEAEAPSSDLVAEQADLEAESASHLFSLPFALSLAPALSIERSALPLAA